MWSSPGLHWCTAPERRGADEVLDPDVQQRIAAIEEAADELNLGAKAFGVATGCWCDDDDGAIGRRVLDAVEERFFAVPRLGCEHYAGGEERLFWLYEGALPAAVCDDVECRERLDWLITATARLPFCVLCTDRSPWLETIETQWPLPWGRCRVRVHPGCMVPPIGSER